MDETSALLIQNPLLLPQNREKTVYDGFITAQEKDFRIRIILPPDRQLREARLQCCWQLKQLLHEYHHIIKQRLHQSSDLASFILELKTVLELALKNRQGIQTLPPPEYYAQLIKEIECLGWDKLVFIDTEFSTLKLKAEDNSSREHLITIKLKAKYPAEPPDCSADLPVPFIISWTTQSSLPNIHSQFLAVLESLKEFWDVLDEIDEKTWVLEPENPTRSATMRRIAIGNNVSVNIEVDPRHPKMLPECCFLGADHVVTPLRNKLNANIHLWNPECTVLQNLMDILEIEFPAPASQQKANFSMECGICYSYRLDSAIPDQVCNDPRCGQPFHQACLYEWLRGLPSSRQSFNIIFGECPYCCKPLTVKMTTKKS
uniref:E3 ubiquitin-protein ligase FANCL n=1 Tax=Lepisosteus oculatus TaxID=7918 RepID=W5NGX4_LEPOC|nr:PREDICTED: E3 ubiquitin-protein ligase FANCL [Lepisosteus oculatus]XP_015218447.1 PREDICTED: E3 ubiquitin-protein ligase FANCL [Lepisosteus oculatus]